jgi:hypothetical protein
MNLNRSKYTAMAALLMILSSGASVVAVAQEDKPLNAVQKVEANSNGNLLINIPDDILNSILNGASEPAKQSSNTRPVRTSGKTSGYRIQVFSDGRNQTTLEARARARGSAIVAKFPKYRGQIYSFSKSPNWYTRVGNFSTAAEANAALQELKRAFPSFASEMRTVKCDIILK